MYLKLKAQVGEVLRKFLDFLFGKHYVSKWKDHDYMVKALGLNDHQVMTRERISSLSRKAVQDYLPLYSQSGGLPVAVGAEWAIDPIWAQTLYVHGVLQHLHPDLYDSIVSLPSGKYMFDARLFRWMKYSAGETVTSPSGFVGVEDIMVLRERLHSLQTRDWFISHPAYKEFQIVYKAINEAVFV